MSKKKSKKKVKKEEPKLKPKIELPKLKPTKFLGKGNVQIQNNNVKTPNIRRTGHKG